jgi:hypothetical protein
MQRVGTALVPRGNVHVAIPARNSGYLCTKCPFDHSTQAKDQTGSDRLGALVVVALDIPKRRAIL